MAPSLSELQLTDIDFPVVEECSDWKYALKYCQLLEEDGILYPELYEQCLRQFMWKTFTGLYVLSGR